MDMMNDLTRLVSAFGPSGAEKEISQVIEELAQPYVDEISRDTLGNLICHKKGSGPKIMFSAHMDSRPPTSERWGSSTWALWVA